MSEILARASGAAVDSGAIAATEAAVGMFERCISSATVTPQNPMTQAVTPEVLALAGRGLATKGNALFVIEVEGGAVRLAPVAYWNVTGESDPLQAGGIGVTWPDHPGSGRGLSRRRAWFIFVSTRTLQGRISGAVRLR